MARRSSTKKRRGGSNATPAKNSSRSNGRQSPVHKFMRTDRPSDVSKAAADQGYSQLFLLNSLAGVADFTGLYDQYKIEKVDLVFIYDAADGVLNSTTYYPRLVIAPDWNDSSAPVVEDDVLQYRQAQTFQFTSTDREFTYTIAPKVAQALFRTAVSSAYMAVTPGWIDTAYADVPHYGVKFFLSNYNTTSFGSSIIRQYVRYHLAMKNSK